MRWVANPFAGSKTEEKSDFMKRKKKSISKHNARCLKKTQCLMLKINKNNSNMKQYFNIFKGNLPPPQGFIQYESAKTNSNYIHNILPASNNSKTSLFSPCYRIIWFQHFFPKKMNCTFIVRHGNPLKIWREDVRLYSWRENKHGWLSHWQQWLLGALAAVDKVTGYQSVPFLSLRACTAT